MGYSKNSKGYRIYFLGFKKIDINRDVTFDEDTAYNKSKKKPTEESKEAEAPRIHDTTMNEEAQEFEEPQRPIDPPLENNPHTRKPAWVQELIQGAERYGLQKKITEKEKGPDPALDMQLYCVISSIKNLPIMKQWHNGKNGRML